VYSASATQPHTNDIDAARRHDEAAFERLVEPYRAALQAHCYRMLGSAGDAEDAVQETLLRAWKGLPRFEGRSSLRAWLYRIATNVSLKAIGRRPSRVLPVDYGPPDDPHKTPREPLVESVWVDAYPDERVGDDVASPEARYELRESVELAFIAALQHLPERQRAVLLLRDVLGFAPSEIATALDATPASVYSALQRAHQAVEERLPARSQQATLRSIGDERLRELVARYVRAWEDGDVPALVGLLTDDASIAMPPSPSWYRGRAAVCDFLRAGPCAAPGRWRRVRARANGQLAFGVYGPRADGAVFPARAVEVLTLDDACRVVEVTSFQEPSALARFGLPPEIRKGAPR
jgi:RNA polymerase sigma-70 factor, ECF subfamily